MLQAVEVCTAAVVLELAGNLHLLGLGSAATHWLDPLDGQGFRGPINARVYHTNRCLMSHASVTDTTVPVLRPARYIDGTWRRSCSENHSVSGGQECVAGSHREAVPRVSATQRDDANTREPPRAGRAGPRRPG
ncbi:hypothetical protein GCM10009727_55980 [Actinomadura napierensis]|uniref:Secreted protein n=1 Tax=Actinomadura napierensis TaxID=267854 RepID=A0ABN3A008_9ACTN